MLSTTSGLRAHYPTGVPLCQQSPTGALLPPPPPFSHDFKVTPLLLSPVVLRLRLRLRGRRAAWRSRSQVLQMLRASRISSGEEPRRGRRRRGEIAA